MQFTEQDIREIYPSYTESGKFFARVTAGDVYPLPGTRLTLYVILPDGTPKPYRVMITNDSGETEVISLPAPPRSLSETPEQNGTPPYATYRLIAEKEGYYPALIERLSIFSGITARQSLRLLPLSESARLGPERLYDASPDTNINVRIPSETELYDTDTPQPDSQSEPPLEPTIPQKPMATETTEEQQINQPQPQPELQQPEQDTAAP